MREKYESLSLSVLKDLAKARGLKGVSTLRKPALIERMLEEDQKESPLENTEEKSTEESLNIEEFFDFATDSDKNTNVAANADPDSDTEVSEADARVYLIQGNEKSSNRYEKADHLSYTTVTKYTLQDLSIFDSYGLKITRNEIFARHGRMFNDQELQEYFKRQQWYVPQIAANDFDTSCLNEVEKYNVNIISVYEEQLGGK